MTMTKAGQAGGKQMGGDIIKGWSTNSLCHKMRQTEMDIDIDTSTLMLHSI